MKIIVINGAPRGTTGNTQTILNPFVVGLKEGGGSTDMVLLADKDIGTCRGCFTCYAKTPGVCAQEDDMPALVDRVGAADMMVLATPLYVDGMTSLAKVFMDRLLVFLEPRFMKDDAGLLHPLRRKFPGKIFLLSVCGYPGTFNFDPLVMHMERIARNLHTEYKGAVLRPAAFSMLMGKKYPEKVRAVMEAITAAGRELVEQGSVSEETLDAVAADICTTDELVSAANFYWDRELASSGDRPA